MGPEPQPAGLFPLGRVQITPEANAALTTADIREALFRHRNGDWGDVDDDTRTENQGGLDCARLAICSRYRAANGTRFWVMTEPERRRTLVLLGTLPESSSYS